MTANIAEGWGISARRHFMKNFHENKLWQDAYVVLMDLHEVADNIQADVHNREIIEDLLEAATRVAAKIADGLSRADARFGRQLIYDGVGLVAITRTQLAVAWGRQLLTDAVFQELDTKYANLSDSLQRFK